MSNDFAIVESNDDDFPYLLVAMVGPWRGSSTAKFVCRTDAELWIEAYESEHQAISTE